MVGINSQIYSRSGGYQGLSFAIPIDTAMYVRDQLVQNGKVTRGRLRVTIQEVNQALANSFGMKKAGGALVSSVEDGSAAAKAGIRRGDIILSVNGAPVTGVDQLKTATKDADRTLALLVKRNDALDLRVGESQLILRDSSPEPQS